MGIPSCCECGGGAAATGGILAILHYIGPPIQTFWVGAVFTDIDPALAVTFTAPASGAVLVRSNGFGQAFGDDLPSPSGSPAGMVWNLREGGVDIPGTEGLVHMTTQPPFTVPDVQLRWQLLAPVTGLVPGSVHTFSWGYRSTAAGDFVSMTFGTIPGGAIVGVPDPVVVPATMVVEALP